MGTHIDNSDGGPFLPALAAVLGSLVAAWIGSLIFEWLWGLGR